MLTPNKANITVITIRDEEEVIERVIDFLYLSTYSDEWYTEPGAECAPMVFNFKLVIVAKEYSIPELEELATRKLMSRLDQMAESEDFRGTIKETVQSQPATTS